MRLLLDTHIAVWAISNHPRLPGAARSLILDEDNAILVSVVSLWEIAIKHALDRDGDEAMPVSASDAAAAFLRAGYSLLPVSATHAVAFEKVPALHKDPFDRMLVAQSISQALRLLTHDRVMNMYGETIIKV